HLDGWQGVQCGGGGQEARRVQPGVSAAGVALGWGWCVVGHCGRAWERIVKSAGFDRPNPARLTPEPVVTDASPDMKLPASLLMAAAAAALSLNVHAQSAKPDLAKGSATFGNVCVACHAADGNSSTPANPKLAQQHPEYLLKQLQEYKSGKR